MQYWFSNPLSACYLKKTTSWNGYWASHGAEVHQRGTVTAQSSVICWCRASGKICERNWWNSLESRDSLTGHCPAAALHGIRSPKGNEAKDHSEGWPTQLCMTEMLCLQVANTTITLACSLRISLLWGWNIEAVEFFDFKACNSLELRFTWSPSPWKNKMIDYSQSMLKNSFYPVILFFKTRKKREG